MALKKMGGLVFFRVSLFSALFLLITLVLLSLAAIQTGSELNVRAQFFSTMYGSATLRNFSQLNTLSPMDLGVRDKKLIDEMLLRYYLEMRYTQLRDTNEMIYRWGIGGPVYLLSTPKLYNAFAGNLEKKIETLPNSVVTIEIESVERKNYDNTFTVNYLLHENLPDGQVRSKAKNAVLEFRYIPSRIRYSAKFSNPYGLVFIRFEETGRKIVSE